MSDTPPPLSAIRIWQDGPRAMGAVLGLNLLEGESEFAAIDEPYGEAERTRAGEQAVQKLERRLGIAHLHLPRVASQDEGPHLVRQRDS